MFDLIQIDRRQFAKNYIWKSNSRSVDFFARVIEEPGRHRHECPYIRYIMTQHLMGAYNRGYNTVYQPLYNATPKYGSPIPRAVAQEPSIGILEVL